LTRPWTCPEGVSIFGALGGRGGTGGWGAIPLIVSPGRPGVPPRIDVSNQLRIPFLEPLGHRLLVAD
jgi:hypothetical protein